MTLLHDMHCHLDFMVNGEEVARQAQDAGTLIFANTVTPAGFEAAQARFGAFSNVRVGLGLHPWWVQAGDIDDQAAAFAAFLPHTRYVGEVGLDFGRRGQANKQEQVEAFRVIARACGEAGDKLLSLHAVRSAETVLDILEESGALTTCTCVFHWFSDTTEQLLRARKAGCYFSIHPMMASTGRGREYVKAIEADQLLLEADAPPQQDMVYSYDELRQQLQKAAECIERQRGCAVVDRIADTAARLLGA